MRREAWFAVQLLLGATTLALLLHFADLGRVLTVIVAADPLDVLLAALAFVLASVIVGYSLFVLLERMGYTLSPVRTVFVSIAGQLVSDLTPARTGYFVTPVILKGELDVRLEDGVAAIVFTGAVQAFASVVLGSVAIVYFSRFIESGLELIALFAFGLLPVALMGLLLLSLIHHGWLTEFLHSLREVSFLKPRFEQIRQAIAVFQRSGRKVTSAAIQVAFFLMVAQIINSVALYLLSLSIGISGLGIFDYVMTYSIAGFTMYAFVTIAGLGVQESMYAILLGLLGVTLDKATAVAILARFFFTITDFMGVPLLTKLGLGSVIRTLNSAENPKAPGQDAE